MKIHITEAQYKLLVEDVNSIPEIGKLANEVIEVFAEKNYSVVRRIQRGIDDISFNSDSLNFKDIIFNVDSYSVLKDFIENSSISITFRDNLPGRSRVKGNYDSGRVNIFYGDYFKDILKYQIGLYGDKEINSSEAKWTFKIALGATFRSTLIHELQHAYDDYRSSGKYASDKKSKKYYSGRNSSIEKSDEEYKIYLTLPHEYWARFSQTVLDIFKEGIEFQELYDNFKRSSIMQFENLADSDKRRLIKALYGYWDLHIKNKG